MTEGTSIAQIAEHYGLDGGALITAVTGLMSPSQLEAFNDYEADTDGFLAKLEPATIHVVEGAAVVIHDYLTLVDYELVQALKSQQASRLHDLELNQEEASFAEFPVSTGDQDVPDGILGATKTQVDEEQWVEDRAQGRNIGRPMPVDVPDADVLLTTNGATSI